MTGKKIGIIISNNLQSKERKSQAMTNAALRGKPDAGNPHVRFDEGEVASAATPRRGSLLYKPRSQNLSPMRNGVAMIQTSSSGCGKTACLG